MTKRSLWYNYLNEPSTNNYWSMVITVFLSVAIVLNIVEVVLGSVAGISVYMADWVLLANYIFATIFGLEYGARLWAAAESPHEKPLGHMRKRWLYVISPMGLIDLLSFLPIILWLILPNDILGDLRILKLISMVRILKLTRYSASLLMLARVYRENKNTLLAAALVMMILMFISATGIYIFERDAQPDAFGSIPASMWWAFVTLTTVGYGDITPITVGGKIFGSVVMVCGVGIAAMPAGIFASSFVQLIREQEHERRIKYNKRKRQVQSSKVNSSQGSGELHHQDMSPSEQREVAYLVDEYNLSLNQAVGVVMHYRR
ncbi:MAG: voltage-gated potassium channel [Oleiphilaceae bacterium]|jgi:voltage-gated potassium channel